MNKKILILPIIILFITGCDVEYNLDFYNEEFSDNLKIGPITVNEGEQFEIVNIESMINNAGYYDIDNKNNYWYLKENYTIDEYKNSEVLNKCFEYSNVDYGEDYYYISANGDFKCLQYIGHNLNKVTFKFRSDLEIEEQNADKIDNGTYIWEFNENNKDKGINIKLIKNRNSISENNNQNWWKFVIPIAGILIIIILYLIYIKGKKNKSKNNNNEF